MRNLWLLPVLLISVPPACSDDGGDDDGADGRAGSDAGGAGGRGAAGASGGAGRGGAAGAAGSAGAAGAAGSAGAAGAAGAAGSGGAAGAAGSGASDATDCEGLCARLPACEDCIDSCEFALELCPDEFAEVLECSNSLSDDELQCVGGVPVPDDDLCVTESSAFARCRIGF